MEANLTEEKTVTGWVEGKGLVQSTTPDGDKILFGEAVDSEDQASQRNGRRYAAQDAMRLYGEVPELFPQSPLAGEAMYRSADIRWQLEKTDQSTLPSAKEQEPYLRKGMDEDYFRKVMKKFPDTKWAYLVGVPPDRQQTLRRLAGAVEVSGKRGGDLRKICGRISSVSRGSRSALRCRLPLGRADRDLQDGRERKEIRRSQGPRHRSRAKSNRAASAGRLERASAQPAVHGAARDSGVWERGVIELFV